MTHKVKTPSGTVYVKHSDNTFVHRRVAELAIGRPLKRSEEVHHVNRNGEDNRNNNLVICLHDYHMLLHARERAMTACGNPSWRPCSICKQYDDIANMHYKSRSYRHVECHRKYELSRREKKGRVGRCVGERHLSAKVKEDQVRQIRRMYAEGVSRAAISKKFGLTWPSIGNICARVTWKHVV